MIVNFKLCKTKICGIAWGGGACHVAKPYWHIIISFATKKVVNYSKIHGFKNWDKKEN
jgi:hypothetical protein